MFRTITDRTRYLYRALSTEMTAALLPSHLERHVFQEVCCAVISLILIAAAGVDPEPHLEYFTEYTEFIHTLMSPDMCLR